VVEYVDHDIVRVWRTADGGRGSADLLVVLYRGDDVEILERTASATRVRLGVGREGWIRGWLRTTAKPPLACAFIDVGQGDACLVTTPSGHRILVDGGENKLAARYLAARYRDDTTAGCSVHFDAIVVTHGDADHFEGLSTLILDAVNETREAKCIRVTASRVYHNGLVKRSSSVAERERLGPPVEIEGVLHAPVVDDPRTAANATRPFRRWNAALDELAKRGPLDVARLDHESVGRFDFLGDVKVDVLGPRVSLQEDGTALLPILSSAEGSGGFSAARTINGHSVVLRIAYGNVSVLLTGDLHAEMQDQLVGSGIALQSDVLKVPHHGSDDVSRRFVEAVSSLVSVISAGDEDARRDHLHPRANLLAMLGQSRRGAEPVVFVTNLSAFDRWAGEAFYAIKDGDSWKPDLTRGPFYARERTAYGIIHVRTDGERLLVARRGARSDRYEAYAYTVTPDGTATSVGIDSV
jgi:beta-lactamase superfamily II metal-dependent hydrolase